SLARPVPAATRSRRSPGGIGVVSARRRTSRQPAETRVCVARAHCFRKVILDVTDGRHELVSIFVPDIVVAVAIVSCPASVSVQPGTRSVANDIVQISTPLVIVPEI